jgi:uncharacterized protein (TIGR02147 family)
MDSVGSDYFRSILLQLFEDRKTSSPRYSLRMFASELGIQAAALSQFFKGQRFFSKKMSRKLAERLGMDPQKIEEVEDQYGKLQRKLNPEPEGLKLRPELYYLLANPLYYSLLCLFETDDFICDVKWMSQKLDFPVTQVEAALKDLIKLEMLKEEGGILRPIQSNLASTDNIPNHSLRIRHQKNMLDAKDAVQNVPLDRRYFAFETLAFDKDDLPIVQKKINELMDDLILLSKRARKKTDVYEFCSLYFPRTEQGNTN